MHSPSAQDDQAPRAADGAAWQDAVIWQGFTHRWGYNHRLNRLGSYVRLGEEGGWVAGHTAASGSGPDTAHVAAFYGAIRSPHLVARPGVAHFAIDTLKGEAHPLDAQVQVPLGAAPLENPRYAVVLNGFDLWAVDGADAHKLMAFALQAGPPQVSEDRQRLTFSLGGSFKAHCATPECRGYPGALRRHRVRYALRVYYLALGGEAETFNVVRPEQRASTAYEWPRRGNEIGPEQGRAALEIPLAADWADPAVANVPGLHRIAIDLEKTGGHLIMRPDSAMHLLQWDMAITGLRRTTGAVAVDLYLLFKNWARGMKAARRPYSEGALRDAGRARLEAGVTLLQVRGGAYEPGQASAAIRWRTGAPASSERARRETPLGR
jgi:hypothetical protein